MKIIHWKRNNCRLCGSSKLKKVLDLEPVPIGEKYSLTPFSKEPQRFPIDLYVCEECHCVQVLDNVDQKFLWSDYTYFSGQTPSIIRHQENFAEYVQNNFNFPSNSKVIDIGSNDGTLLKSFERRGFHTLGIDPAETVAKVAKENGIETIVELFSDKIISKIPEDFKQVDLITAFNVFAHSDDMNGMINGVKKLLREDGIFVFEVQYLLPILDKKLLGTIFHEHMIHYSVTSANNFLKTNDLKIIDVQQNNIQKGSIIFFATKKNNKLKQKKIVNDLLLLEEEKYLDDTKFVEFKRYIEKIRTSVEKLKHHLKVHKKSICAFGAARSGPTLAIQYKMENIFSCIIDDHPSKIGKYAPFENLKVESSEYLVKFNPDYSVILAWIHNKNIVKNHLEYLKQGGTFIILWPDYKEITIENYEKWIND